MRKIIGSIDIGSDTIKLIIGEFHNNKVNILFSLAEPTVGYKDNEITSKADFIQVIHKILKEASTALGFKVKKFIVNVPASKNSFIANEVVNTINNDDGKINGNDILRVMQTAAYNQIASSEELIAVLPIKFMIDGNEIDKPFGKKAKSLTLKAILVTAPKQEVHEMVTILEECGIEVIDVTTTGLTCYYNFKNDNYDNKTGIIINLGDYKTTLSVFSKGKFINNEVIDTGGAYIDRDLAVMYDISKKEAKNLKETLALATTRKANPKETLNLVNMAKEELTLNQYEVSEIVGKRIEDILKLSKKSINLLTKKEISYIIITGGLTELKEFPIALRNVFGEKAKIGGINIIGLRDNKYSVALGMIKYFNDKLSLRKREYSTISESEVDVMCNIDSKPLSKDSILGKVFGYFFDN